MPDSIENEREDGQIGQAHGVIWMDGRTRNKTPSVQMECERGEDMDEDGCELVKAVEDQAVLPHNNGKHKDTHTEHIVGLKCS